MTTRLNSERPKVKRVVSARPKTARAREIVVSVVWTPLVGDLLRDSNSRMWVQQINNGMVTVRRPGPGRVGNRDAVTLAAQVRDGRVKLIERGVSNQQWLDLCKRGGNG